MHASIRLPIALAVALATASATAGGTKPTPKPDPAPVVTTPQKQWQTQTQDQHQAQHSDATAAASASASASGGAANGEVNIGGDTSSTRAYALALPMPLNVPQITPATAACSLASSSGLAIGWNFYSHSGAKQVIDGLCVAERQAAAYELQCKYRTAAAIRYWIAQKATAAPELQRVEYEAQSAYEWQAPDQQPQMRQAQQPATLASELGAFLALAAATPYERERDLTMEECHKPKVVYVERPAPVAAPAPAPARKVVRKPRPKPKAVAPCPPGQTLRTVCVARP